MNKLILIYRNIYFFRKKVYGKGFMLIDYTEVINL